MSENINKKEPWYKRMQGRLTLVAIIISVMGTLGYNVRASLPPTRSEVNIQVAALELLIDEAKQMTITLSAAVQTNTRDRMFQRYKFLIYKQDTQGLDIPEQVELCDLADILGLEALGCQ